MLFSRLLQKIPSQCAVCRGWDRRAICNLCVTRFAVEEPRCARCAHPVPSSDVHVCGQCLVNPPEFDGALAAVNYAHPWSALIAQHKFRDGLDLTEALAARLLAACQRTQRPVPGLMLPVPLSAQRLRERGYNQAWELTRWLGLVLRVPTDARLLLRVRDTPHQLALPPDQRAANVRGVFAIEPLRRTELQGRTVAVVDDVLTTGATFNEIARVLKQAGALRVEAWALARTPRSGR